jgi:hypothetical protein
MCCSTKPWEYGSGEEGYTSGTRIYLRVLATNLITIILDKLEIGDLMDTKSALWDARAKWEDIGRCIGVDAATLDTMRGKPHGDSLNGVLSHWLRGVHKPGEKNSKTRTWCTLIEALREKVVHEEAMANKLEKEKYPDTNQGT